MSYLIRFEATSLFQECHHIQPSLTLAVLYCLGVATAFVGALYVLVPPKVQRLNRDDPLQIQWRTFATCTVCGVAIVSYPFFFCSSPTSSHDMTALPVLQRMGFLPSSYEDAAGYSIPGLVTVWYFLFGALAHSIQLYMGPLMVFFLQAKLMAESSTAARTPLSATPSITTYIECLGAVLFPTPFPPRSPAQQRIEFWTKLRNYVIAPTLEEIAFRGCMVPPLMATGLFHPWAVALIAPLFFGLAHCHHASLKLKQGVPLGQVLESTSFQFLYTTLFGAYAAHAFLRSRSIVAVILSHSFCNAMGLPSGVFLEPTSRLYLFKTRLLKAHLLGMAIFIWGFTIKGFLPFYAPY